MKPSLQQIADMPHTQAVNAMREHYDPQWPMVTSDPDELVHCDLCFEPRLQGELDGGFCSQCLADVDDDL